MEQPPVRQAQVITALNLKGGVGKTHTVWVLASVCQERGQRVLLIDTDTQGNLSSSFLEEGSPTPGVERLLHPGGDGDVHPLIRRTKYPHIDFISSSPAVAPFDLSNQAEWEKSDLHLSFLAPVAAVRSQYDVICFDCPPRLSLVSFAALCASDAIIIPMEAADWGAQGIMQVTAAVEYVQQHYNAQLQLLGYLVSRFKKARSYQKGYLKQTPTLRAHPHHRRQGGQGAEGAAGPAFSAIFGPLARRQPAETKPAPPANAQRGFAQKLRPDTQE